MPSMYGSRRSPASEIGAVMIACSIAFGMAGCRGDSAEHYLSAGDKAVQASKLADAEQDYQQAVKLAPNEVATHVALGNLYVIEHRSGAAQVELMKVLELDPKNARAHVALGNLYLDDGQLGLAEEQYRAAVVLDPAQPTHRLDLGSALVKEGKLGEAESELRTAIGLDPKNAQAHFALGNLLASQPNRRTEADSEFQQARALNPRLVVPTPVAAAAPTAEASAPAPAAVPNVKPLNKLFLITHSSNVYETPDAGSRVIAHVVRKKYVHVTGVAGDWLQVKLRNGTVGFVPVTAAE
jgi:tetratricopeptide (TPR) repeat protein